MAKHTQKEILGAFAHNAGHTHEHACQAIYDLGFATGHATALEEAQTATTPTTDDAAGDYRHDDEAQKNAQPRQESAGPAKEADGEPAGPRGNLG